MVPEEGLIGTDAVTLPAGAGAALGALLERCPDAMVGALTGGPVVRMVPLPAGVPVAPTHRIINVGTLFELVTVPDQAVVAKLWGRARSVGAASAVVHLLDAQRTPASLSFFDLRDVHGAMVVVIADAAVTEVPAVAAAPAEPAPSASPLGRVWANGAAVIKAVGTGVEQLLGWAPDELVGRRTLELVHPEDQEKAIDEWLAMLDFPGHSRPMRIRLRHRADRWVWAEVTSQNRLNDPRHGDVVSELVDISDEIAAHEAARARQQLLEQVTETLPLGLFHADPDGRLLYANFQFKEMTGLAAGALLLDWPGVLEPKEGQRVLANALDTARQGIKFELQMAVESPDGQVRFCSLGIRPLFEANGAVTGLTGSVEDVTERETRRRELEIRAATDSLTGCLNRAATMAVLQDALDDLAGGRSDGVAIVFVDVDGLKALNDRLGHAAGDALLVEVGDRLRNAVRASDTVGRIGGDEFVVVAASVRGADDALNIARWIVSRTLRDMDLEGTPLAVRASVGVAWTDTPVKAAALVRRADEAMYRSKRDGRCEPVMA